MLGTILIVLLILALVGSILGALLGCHPTSRELSAFAAKLREIVSDFLLSGHVRKVAESVGAMQEIS